MSKIMLFVASVVLTAGILLVVIYVNRSEQTGAEVPELVSLSSDIFLASQLTPEHIQPLKLEGIRSVIDIRPDGEAADQPSSDELSVASLQRGMKFHYVPVPHETIPDEAVDALVDALAQSPRPSVLYCRTGRRAARTFALAEASRVEGPETDAILEMIRMAGFSADDLREKIAERISRRSSTSAAKK